MSWQPIDEFPGYEVSMDGQVRSWCRGGDEPTEITPVWLKSQRWGVRMTREGKRYLRCIANIVLEAFQGPPPQDAIGTGKNPADVVFKDGDPTNITLSNLTWKTQ